MSISDWSSDVCSSDLGFAGPEGFKREFELAAGADAGKTEGGRADSHLLHHLAGARAMGRRTRTVIRARKARAGRSGACGLTGHPAGGRLRRGRSPGSRIVAAVWHSRTLAHQ